MFLIVLCLGVEILCFLYLCAVSYFSKVWVTECTYWEMAVHSAYVMFPQYKCLIVNLVFFSNLGVNSWIFFLIVKSNIMDT